MLCVLLCGCGNGSTKEITIEGLKADYVNAGYEITKDKQEVNELALGITGAESIYQMYIDKEYVTFYVYKSQDELKSVTKIYDHFKDNAKNGNWMMAGGTEEMIKIFKK